MKKKPQSIKKNIRTADMIVFCFNTFLPSLQINIFCIWRMWDKSKADFQMSSLSTFFNCFSSVPPAQMGQVAAGRPLCNSQVDPAILYIFTFKETSHT
jgi:hypothetical protein